MFPNERKINSLFLYWLILSLLLVFIIIIIGGLTRLTNSGLSITEWELLTGILPPLNNNSWNLYFEEYKKIPQYKLLNFNMTLSEFKVIFYWEYFHRMIARFIGLFFLIPLIYFYFSRKIKVEYIKICFLIFSLIFVQGIVGWYMVQSGLVNNTTVSHYRLSIHLSLAIIIISTIFWLFKNFYSKKIKNFFTLNFDNLPFQFLILLIYFQIIMGALLSGLDAGQIYQTWPKMGNTFIPNDINYNNFIDALEFDNHSLVQFYHRGLAYLIIFYTAYLTVSIYKKGIVKLFSALKILLAFLILQVLLGILTLVSGLNIYLASMHQITSVLLVFSALNLYYLRAK